MNFENVPQELKVHGLWCLWKLIPGKGKIPFDAMTSNYAKSNDKSTFHSFKKAISVIHRYYGFNHENQMTGGLGLGVFNGFSAIDIDNCRNKETGELSELAEDIIDFCNSYTEISPSGTGIRIILKTSTVIDKDIHYINNSKNGLEIYISDNTNKFVTITGNAIKAVEIRDVNLQYVLDKYMLKKQRSGAAAAVIGGENSNVDGRLKKALQKDRKLVQLWNQVAPGSNANESELDLALCNKIAFYVDGDIEQTNKMFMLSPYFLSKDDKHKTKWTDRRDYREMTLQKAVESSHEIATGSYDELDLNDTGNALRLAEKFGEVIRFNVDNGRWMIWNGMYWQTDVYNRVKSFAELIAEDLKQRALITDIEEIQKAIYRNVKRILSSSGKTAMLKEAEHLPGIPVTNDDFDKETYLINCESGIVNLRTGEVTEHDKDRMLSKFIPYKLTDEKPVKWLQFLSDIFENDNDVIDYVHQVSGYSLTGSMREQCMFILVGDGANGKSLFLELINQAAGSYGATSNVEILLEKRNQGANLGDVARLNKIRNVVTDETKIGDKLNESAIKTMTSGIGKIVARFLYGNEFEFNPQFKIFMATNHKPVIRGTDHGIWRRLKIIPFNRVFTDEEQDKDLVLKLKDELDGIFTWMVQGAKIWYQNGLREPGKLKEAVKEYRTEMDLIQRWIEEACDLNDNVREKAMDLFDNFSQYVQINKEFQMSQTLFGRNMSKKFKKRRLGGVMYYEGIRIKRDSIYYLSKEEYDNV